MTERTKNTRIPPEIKKEINRIGPGKYVDPSTGRIYIDSADMDDDVDEMVDQANLRAAEVDKRQDDLPPEEYLMNAKPGILHAVGRLQEREDHERRAAVATEYRSTLRARLSVVRGFQAYKETRGLEPDPEHALEIEALEKEIADVFGTEEEDHEEGHEEGAEEAAGDGGREGGAEAGREDPDAGGGDAPVRDAP